MSSLAGSPGHGGAGSDPFPAVKRELDEQMQQLAALGAQLCAAAEGAGAAGAAAAAGSFLAVAGHVAQQLDALEAAVAAMVLQPARFRLTLRQAMQRQLEVATLRFQLSDLLETCGLRGDAPMRSSATGPDSRPSSGGRLRKALPPPPPGAGSVPKSAAAVAGVAAPDHDARRAGDAVQQQQQLMRQQDAALDHISLQVESVRHTGQAMHKELEEQAALLGGLEAHADSTQLRLRGAAHKVAALLRRWRQDRQLCCILALAGLLVVLTMIALA